MSQAEQPKAEAKKILEAKDKLTEVLPHPPSQQTPISSAQALKERLDWGEPALTIVDARDREAFLAEHITGAIPMFGEDTSARLKETVASSREIYVYGDSDEKTSEAAEQLRKSGFESVSQLRGGLAGWKAISGSTEGREA
jgi:rhodanese-related sulfurtransferase